MATVKERMRKFFESLSEDIVEERVLEYVVREVHNGRRLMEVIDDPYVKNRLNPEKVDHMLQNPAVVEALEQEIAESFKMPDAEVAE
ncbi:MAG: hypothetical protein HY876_07965 [Coriobacteriales bacterium]|nr:hypothetical protein [Coriobacteriales bacterium]